MGSGLREGPGLTGVGRERERQVENGNREIPKETETKLEGNQKER